ncbi:hypothetical protein KIH41_14840 [Litoribacter ruber]|uniref:hypothetical protein n=1 Tax=Litoribacter ruber TaxID=702568 RepID=UPI001BD9C165|nr:hypothetical protein [Litoribacter ruber]MBT0812562.1 hypothetical protein [Litoribacter ruber]
MKKNLWILFFLTCLNLDGLAQGYSNKTPRHSLFFAAGPGFMYADNGGRLSMLDFKTRPTFDAGYIYHLTPKLGIRATLGTQWLQSNTQVPDRTIEKWGERNQAFAFSGNAYYFDIMPEITIGDPYKKSPNRFYGGVGMGVLQVYRTQQTLIAENIITKDAFTQTAYFPIRFGYLRQLNLNWSAGAEGSFFFTLSDDLDGNVGYNTFGNDYLFQFKLAIRRTLYQ